MAREPAYVAAQRRVLGRRLAEQRRTAGLTQLELARALHYERTSVTHIEAGRQPAPRSFWQRADQLLHADGALLAGYEQLDAAHSTRHAVHRAARCDQPSGQSMRWAPSVTTVVDEIVSTWAHALPAASVVAAGPAALRWLVALPDSAPRREHGWRQVNLGDVSRIRTARHHLKSVDDGLGGSAALAMAESYLRHEVAPLLGARYSADVGRALLSAVAELNLDLGWMAYDAGRQPRARRHMLHALRLAHAADDRLFGGRVLSALSHQALHLGRVAEALDLARAANAGTRSVATPTATAMFAAMEACAAAAAGEARACAVALSVAERALDAVHGDDGPDWLDFDEGGLWGHAARAHRDLDRADDAQQYATKAISLCRPEHRRTRAQRSAILAGTLLRAGDLEQACAVGRQLVVDAWKLHSELVLDDLRRLTGAAAAQRSRSADAFVREAKDVIAARSVVERP